MNRSCCSILITSVGSNPSLNAMIQQSTDAGWAIGRAWLIKKALDDYFGEIDDDTGAEAKKNALDDIQMGIEDDPQLMFDQLWQQFSCWSDNPKLRMNDYEMRLNIKTKVPGDLYSGVIKSAEIAYRQEKDDNTLKIPP